MKRSQIISITILAVAIGLTPTGSRAQSIDIGTLPAGASVVVTYQVDVDDPLAIGENQVSEQVIVNGSSFAALVSDDPDTATPDDPTLTDVFALPLAMCQPVTKTADLSNTASVLPVEFDDGSIDPDSPAVALTYGIEPAGPFPSGLHAVVFSVTDDELDSATCETTIMVLGGGPTATFTPQTGPTATFTPTLAVGTPTSTPITAPTATFTPTEDPSETSTPTVAEACDSGYYVLDSLGGRHQVGVPYTITGPLYFGNPIARDMERAVCTIKGTRNASDEDLVVLDGYGAAHFVSHVDCNIPQTFYFGDQAVAFPQGRAVDLVMSTDSDGLWVLTDFGGIYRAGSSGNTVVPGTDSLGLYGFDVDITAPVRDPNLADPGGATLRAVSLVVIDEDLDNVAEGYVMLDSMGGRLQLDNDGQAIVADSSLGAPAGDPSILLDPTGYVWPFFPGLDIARDMELFAPTQEGVVILDGWDGIHPVPVDEGTNAVFFANNVISVTDTTPAQLVGMPYITNGFDDPMTAANEGDPGQVGPDAASIFTDLEFSAGCPDGLYTLDKFGGVFVMGSARPFENEVTPDFGDSPYFFPFLYAEDMELFAANETDPRLVTGFRRRR